MNLAGTPKMLQGSVALNGMARVACRRHQQIWSSKPLFNSASVWHKYLDVLHPKTPPVSHVKDSSGCAKYDVPSRLEFTNILASGGYHQYVHDTGRSYRFVRPPKARTTDCIRVASSRMGDRLGSLEL